MHRRAASLVMLIVLAALPSACLPLARTPTVSASPSLEVATSSPSSAPSPSAASPSPSSSPSPISSVDVHVTAVASLPVDPHFFSLGGPDSARILLFDSAATRPPIEVVQFDLGPGPGGPDVRMVAFGASTDGRVLVIARRFSEQRTVHYLVRPQTGEVVVLLEDVAPSFSVPVVSPDGTRYAYARLGDANSTGVWIVDAHAGPDRRRIVGSDPQIVGSPPQPVAWSPDGAWLAVTTGNDAGDRIGVVQIQAGETVLDVGRGTFAGGNARMLGTGREIDWRGGEQNLLITSSRHAFGGRSFVYTTTLAGGQPREVYIPSGDALLAAARWHPALDRFFVYETPFCCGANRPATIWLRKADGTGTKLFDGQAIDVPWWSKDGTRLWAQTVGDDSVSGFRDLLSTTQVMFCLRSASPPCA